MLAIRDAIWGLALGACALTCGTTPPCAEEAHTFEWSVTGTGTSDYIFRGISLNNEKPAAQASIDGSYGILYAGIWGSMVPDEYAPAEIDFYAGAKPVWGPVTFDFGIVYYTYFWAKEPSTLDYVELKAGLEFSPIANLTLSPVLWYVPDQKNSDPVYALETTASYELPAAGIFTPTVSALLGYTEADSDGTFFGDLHPTDKYTYWNAGLALAVEKFEFDFRYWDTNLIGDGLADERFIFTASVTLP